jgi:hypothetical protein
MAQTAALVDALKRELKVRGITYAHLAPALKLSEASVKRMFSRCDFTLKRLDEICHHAHLEFLGSDSRARTQGSAHLATDARAGKGDRGRQKLFLVAVCALNHVTFDQIVERYDVRRRVRAAPDAP